jgi:hypothetical protein
MNSGNFNMGPKADPEVIITFEGEKVTVNSVGFEGTDCVKATASLLEALGAKDVKRTLKPEYMKAAKKVKTERLRLG